MVESGFDSDPVTPFIFGLSFFIQPSMWSKERFSMTTTTMVLIGLDEVMGRLWSRNRRVKIVDLGVVVGEM